MLLVSGMCMSNAETQSDLLCCCHSSQNTIAEHELSDNLTRRVQLCSTKCCNCFLDDFAVLAEYAMVQVDLLGVRGVHSIS